jgi:hypothetical protein
MPDPVWSPTFCVSDPWKLYADRPAGFRAGVLLRVAVTDITIGCAAIRTDPRTLASPSLNKYKVMMAYNTTRCFICDNPRQLGPIVKTVDCVESLLVGF